MTFNKCSIGGRSYGEVIDPQTGEVIETIEVSERNAAISALLLTIIVVF
jgi:hypothetical protein